MGDVFINEVGDVDVYMMKDDAVDGAGEEEDWEPQDDPWRG
jgi:hypothetical protein